MLGTVLSRMIPMLGACKHENMQWVFAYGELLGHRIWYIWWSLAAATARFGEAIVDFLADEERAASKGIRTEDFEGEAYSIYELFSTLWLQSKEAKVRQSWWILPFQFICGCLVQLRLAVAEAIGYTVQLLSTSQLDGQLARLMPAVAQLYKKHQDHYFISQVDLGQVSICESHTHYSLCVCATVSMYGGGCCLQEEVWFFWSPVGQFDDHASSTCA